MNPANTVTDTPLPSIITIPSNVSPPIGWTSFTNANEMVNDLAFDNDGHLWVTSQGGLVMWDIASRTYKKYTTADGLPSNRIGSIFITKEGIIWVGSSAGISSFDGKKWLTYKNLEGQGFVSDIFQDSHEQLWFVGDSVTTYDGRKWKTYTIADGLGSNSAASFAEDRKGNIWLGTWFPLLNACEGCSSQHTVSEGVSRFNGKSWDVLGKEIGLDDNEPSSGIQVNAIAVDDKGGIWFGTSGFGAKFYNGTKTKSFMVEDGLPDNTITDIQIDKNDTVWFATDSGVTSYDGVKWKSFLTQDGLVDNSVLSIAVAPDDSIWFGTKNGISRFDGNKWQTYRTDDGLPTTRVNEIASTTRGAIWLATNKGAAYFDGQSWKVSTTDDGLPGNEISSVNVAPDGSVWFGTIAPGKVARLAQGELRTFTSLSLIPDEGVYGIVFDEAGGTWVGSYHGYYFDGHTWTEPGANVNTGRYSKMIFSSQSGFWTGTWGGISRFDKQKWWQSYGDQIGLDIRALTVAPNGSVWVATELSDETFHTETGFKSFDGETWKLETVLKLRDVTDMDFSADGTLWVATREGAYKFDGKDWTHYTVAEGLAGNTIIDIHVASDGAIWFATLDGLTRFEQ
jgi:ligand-binding sensor domain-containing protein